MPQNLDIAQARLKEAATNIVLEIGHAKTDEQQEALALMLKGIEEIKAQIYSYE